MGRNNQSSRFDRHICGPCPSSGLRDLSQLGDSTYFKKATLPNVHRPHTELLLEFSPLIEAFHVGIQVSEKRLLDAFSSQICCRPASCGHSCDCMVGGRLDPPLRSYAEVREASCAELGAFRSLAKQREALTVQTEVRPCVLVPSTRQDLHRARQRLQAARERFGVWASAGQGELFWKETVVQGP